jgi:hypothetical protein
LDRSNEERLRHWHRRAPAQRCKLEVTQQMANYESARTTGLYDWRNDQESMDEVKCILI